MREYRDYLSDILDSIQKIGDFVEGMSFDDFMKDEKTLYAVIRALEIIGEAVKKIPSEQKEKYSHIEWKEIAGMRNKLVHEYFGVIPQVVWETIEEDIQPLKIVVEEMLK